MVVLMVEKMAVCLAVLTVDMTAALRVEYLADQWETCLAVRTAASKVAEMAEN